jgi:copper resistance protein D
MARMEMAPEWLIAVIVWPALAAQLLAMGSAALAAALAALHGRRSLIAQKAGCILVPWWRAFALINLVFFGIMILAKTAGMAGVSWAEAPPLIGEVMRETHAGHVWEWQALASVIFAAITLAPIKMNQQVIMVPILSAALLLANSLTSHALDYGRTAIVIDFVHQMAGGLWAGALLGCWLIARSGNDAALEITASRMLSRMAVGSVMLLALSGIYLGWRAIGFGAHELLHATYSHVLMVKLLLFAAALAIGARNRLLLIPRLELEPARIKLLRNVALEAMILLIVIGVAAVLANTSPPRM